MNLLAVTWGMLVSIATIALAVAVIRTNRTLDRHLAEEWHRRAGGPHLHFQPREPVRIRLYGGPYDGETRGLPPIPNTKFLYETLFEGDRCVYAYTGENDSDGHLRFQHMPGGDHG